MGIGNGLSFLEEDVNKFLEPDVQGSSSGALWFRPV